MARHVFTCLFLLAALAGCSAPSASQGWDVSDLEGSWSLVLSDIPKREDGVPRASEDGGATADAGKPDIFALDVSVRDGRIVGCKLNPGARDDRCVVREGLFYVETSDPGSPALAFVLKRRTATRFEGGAAIDVPLLGRQAVGTAVMTKVR